MKYTITTLALIMLVPSVAFGVEFKTLVNFPGVGDPLNSFDSFIDGLYVLSISIAALLAVIKIVVAGVKYMMTDIVTSKGEAKKDITGAIIGLIVILSAVLILTVINPNLTTFNLSGIPEIPLKGGSGGGGGGNGGSSNTAAKQALLDQIQAEEAAGGKSYYFMSGSDQNLIKDACENVDNTECSIGFFSNNVEEINCYQGTYIPGSDLGQGGGYCLVSAAERLLDEYPCKQTGTESVLDPSSGDYTERTTYSCIDAKANCTQAGGVAQSTTKYSSVVKCTY